VTVHVLIATRSGRVECGALDPRFEYLGSELGVREVRFCLRTEKSQAGFWVCRMHVMKLHIGLCSHRSKFCNNVRNKRDGIYLKCVNNNLKCAGWYSLQDRWRTKVKPNDSNFSMKPSNKQSRMKRNIFKTHLWLLGLVSFPVVLQISVVLLALVFVCICNMNTCCCSGWRKRCAYGFLVHFAGSVGSRMWFLTM
jgi:hypothetical protein